MASEAFVRIVADTDGLEAQIVRETNAAVNAAERGIQNIDINVDVDTDRANRSFGELSAAASRGGTVAASSLVGGFQAAMSTPAGAAGITAAAVAAVLTIGPAVAALGVGAGVAAIAFSGFGDAVSAIISGDQEKINKALVGLAPSAISVLSEFQTTLLPVLREIKDSVQQAFFQPLIGALTQLAPLLQGLQIPLQQVSTAMGELTATVIKSLTDPGTLQDFQRILNDTAKILPVLAPLIGALLSGAITTLSGIMHGAVVVGEALNSMLQRAYDFGIQLRAGIDLLIFKFQGLVSGIQTAVTNGIGAFLRFQQNVRDKISQIVTNIGSLPGRILTALGSLGSTLSGIASRAFSSMRTAVSSGINNVLSTIRGLPGRARSALGNVASILYNSGRALIQGFINGITSKIGSMISAITNAVGKARDLFPFSPAKVGPFSGRGYTTYSGAALIEGFIEGIRSAAPNLQNALSGALGGAQIALASGGATPAASTAGTPAQRLATDVGQGIHINPAAPVVQVMIGNRVITEHVQVLIDRNNHLRDRIAAQGVRR